MKFRELIDEEDGSTPRMQKTYYDMKVCFYVFSLIIFIFMKMKS